jgi:hypothetical protein
MKATSRATKNYDEKNEILAKTYKLPRQLVEEFAAKCNSDGLKQSQKLADLMLDFLSPSKQRYGKCCECGTLMNESLFLDGKIGKIHRGRMICDTCAKKLYDNIRAF